VHGTIFLELKRFVVARLGASAWPELLKRAGFADRLYLATETYPDAEAVGLVKTACEITGKPASALLEEFGRFIAAGLIASHRTLIKPHWKTLDLLEQTEAVIHTSVRALNKSATPPRLRTERTGPREVVITYDSPRRLCALAKGIALGVADHYKERLAVDEPSCMHKGALACRLVFRLNS
jgi:hypothetical protein